MAPNVRSGDPTPLTPAPGPYELLARELVRALRGRRTQSALSRRLGYRSHVVQTWEGGENFPTAAKFMRLARLCGRPPAAALRGFLRRSPAWLEAVDLEAGAGVAQLLRELWGDRPKRELASALGRDRFATARLLSGESEPRLPDFLRFVDTATLLLPDFIAAWVDPARLPSIAERWSVLESARRSAYELPWSHAVLRVVELPSYRGLARHRPGFIASRLGISTTEEQRCLELLCASGHLRFEDERYVAGEALTVDLRADPQAARHLASFWMREAARRVEAAGEGNFAFNVFGVSHAALEELRALQRSYFQQLRAIVARSPSTECVVVASYQLFPIALDAAPCLADDPP